MLLYPSSSSGLDSTFTARSSAHEIYTPKRPGQRRSPKYSLRLKSAGPYSEEIYAAVWKITPARAPAACEPAPKRRNGLSRYLACSLPCVMVRMAKMALASLQANGGLGPECFLPPGFRSKGAEQNLRDEGGGGQSEAGCRADGLTATVVTVRP